MVSILKAEFSYRKNSRNEPHIVAIILKIEDLVNNAQGHFVQEWKDVKNEREFKLSIDLPDKTHVDALDRFLDDIQALIDEDKLLPNNKLDPEDCSNLKQEIDQTNENDEMGSESLFTDEEDDDNDETWMPSFEKDNVPKGREQSSAGSANVQNKKIKLSNNSKDDGTATKKEQPEKSLPEDEEKASERRKIFCPVFTCRAQVIHLPRHMRNAHQWTKEAASKVLSKFNIRKRKDKEKKPVKKDYHSRRRCPLGNCHSVVQRLPAHLQNVHKLNKTSKEYGDALENAHVVADVGHPTIVWQEDRFQTKLWEGKGKGKQCEKEGSEDEELHVPSRDVRTNTDSCSDEDSSGESKIELLSTVGMPALLADFEDWLRSPDGGKRDEKTVKQHGGQLFGMLKAIDDDEDVKSLLDVKLVRQVFLKSYVKTKHYEAGTIKSYLMSLRHFYSFLLSDRPENVVFNIEEVNAAREKIKMWSASYKKEASTRKWQKLEEDTLNRLTPTNIRNFEKSDTAREAIKIIGKHSDTTQTTPITQQSYTLVRDFLFTQIFVNNANRPGVLAGMTIQEYKRMTKQDDHYVITVLKHKTAHVHGPARIVLNSKLKSWLSIFVEVMRPQITSATIGNVFLSWNGKDMGSGHITKAVQSVFKKGGMDVKVTSTSFRKAAVSKVHADNPALSGKLARHMAHSEATAKKYYLLTEKSKESVETSKKLGELMRCDDKDVSECGSNKQEDERSTESKRIKKVPWNEKDLEKIKEAFEKEIAAETITMDTVRDRIETREELHGMTPRRVYDKIRKEFGKPSQSSKPALELPQSCESLEDKISRMGNTEENTSNFDDQLSISIIAPTERNSNFTNTELTTLLELFPDMIKENRKICRIEIQQRCSKNKEGQILLNKLSVLQIISRIKYERRKNRLASKQ